MNQNCVEVIEALCNLKRGTYRAYRLQIGSDEWPALRGFKAGTRTGWSCIEYSYCEPVEPNNRFTRNEEFVCLFGRAINEDLVAGAWFPRNDPEDYKVGSVPGRNSTLLTCVKEGKTLGCLIKAGFPRDLGSVPWLSGQGYMYYCERLLSTPFKQLQHNVLAGVFSDPFSAAMDIVRNDFGFRHERIPQPL